MSKKVEPTTELAFRYEVESSSGARLIWNIDSISAEESHAQQPSLRAFANAQPAGIHIPVVREDDFFTKP